MISVTILAKNCQKSLKDTLESAKHFPEIILLDTGSTDGTLGIAQKYPQVKIRTSPFLGFGPCHNLMAELASHDWILSIDSDEVLSPELVQEIQTLQLDQDTVYSLERHNFFNGKHIKWCGGWHPDRVVRLYHKKTTRFTQNAVHEKVIPTHKIVSLKSPLFHTPYREIGDFLTKMQMYSTLFAEQEAGKRKPSVWSALGHSWYAFFKSYLLKRGFLGGREGLIISLYNAHTTFYKYLKLSEKT